MIERDIQYFNDPFKYVVIDDFFSKEDLEFVTNTLNTNQEKKDFDNIIHSFLNTVNELENKDILVINSANPETAFS